MSPLSVIGVDRGGRVVLGDNILYLPRKLVGETVLPVFLEVVTQKRPTSLRALALYKVETISSDRSHDILAV